MDPVLKLNQFRDSYIFDKIANTSDRYQIIFTFTQTHADLSKSKMLTD